MSLKRNILERLQSLGVDDKLISDNIADVIRGESVRIIEKPGKMGDLEVVRVERTRKPEDLMRGLIAFDILSGGELGIASEELLPRKARDANEFLRKPRKLPEAIDVRIVSDNKPLPSNDD
tara:strand:- start:597 stop:959 length:363 start_codon:yes stop_codon:yes gene_type:complete